MFIVFSDGLTNVLSRLGFGKAAQGRYTHDNNSAQYGALYETSWVAQKAIDLPVADALRKWRKWNGDVDFARAIAEEEERINLIGKLKHCAQQARLHGKAALFVGTNVKTLALPMQPSEKILFLNQVSGSSLAKDGTPLSLLTENQEPDHYIIDGVKVHKSRLVILGDGRSVIGAAFDAIRNSDSVAANIAEMIYEAKLDVYKVPDLLHQDDDLLFKRLTLANQGKSIVNGIVLDAEEDYEQKQINFAGLKDILFASYQIVAGAVNMPAAKLLGTSVSGLNATGDNEVKDYDDYVMSIQRDMENALVHVDALLCYSVGVPNADYEWLPLRSATPKEQADIYQANANTLSTLANLEIYSDEELRATGEKLLGDLVAQEADGVY